MNLQDKKFKYTHYAFEVYSRWLHYNNQYINPFMSRLVKVELISLYNTK